MTCQHTYYTSARARSIVATHNGSERFGSSVSPSLIQVVTASPASGPLVTVTTTLCSSADPVVTGQAVTYRAAVRPASTGGAVRFSVDGRAIAGCGAVKTDQKGTAVCHAVHRAAGEKIVQAVYLGNSHFARSVSNQVVEVVHWSLSLRGRPALNGRAATATLRCASKSQGCRAVLALTLTKAVRGRRTVTVAVGSASGLVRAGHARRLTVRLTANGRRLLAADARRPVKLTTSLARGKRPATVATRML